MRLTPETLKPHNPCSEQYRQFLKLYPKGADPTIEVLITLWANGIDSLWLVKLLPTEGANSKREFDLFCAEQVQHLTTDKRVAKCIEVIRRKVADPASVSDAEMEQARKGAHAAYAAAGAAAAGAAAGAAADAAAANAAYYAAAANAAAYVAAAGYAGYAAYYAYAADAKGKTRKLQLHKLIEMLMNT